MCCGFVQVVGASDRHDGLQMRWPLDCGLHLCASEVADADHADIAVGPGLSGRPFDQVVHVATLLSIEKAESAPGTTGAPIVGDNVHVPSRYEEVAGSGFDEACRCTQVLDLPRIG